MTSKRNSFPPRALRGGGDVVTLAVKFREEQTGHLEHLRVSAPLGALKYAQETPSPHFIKPRGQRGHGTTRDLLHEPQRQL